MKIFEVFNKKTTNFYVYSEIKNSTNKNLQIIKHIRYMYEYRNTS